MEIGDIVREIGKERPMTILRFVGDDDGDALRNWDNDLRVKGFEKGSPVCQWFEGSALKNSTFKATGVETIEEEDVEAYYNKLKPVSKPDEDMTLPPSIDGKEEDAPSAPTRVVRLDASQDEEDTFSDD